MQPVTTYLILACVGVYALLLIVDLIRREPAKRILLEAAALVAAAAILHVTTGFPKPSGLRAFGGLGPLPVIFLMFVSVTLGMAARYLFNLRRRFSWLSFLKPLSASPVVLLPLLGTVQGVSNVEPIQVITFSFLAFQNGFFWRVILERASTQA